MTIANNTVPLRDDRHAEPGIQDGAPEDRALLDESHPECNAQAVQTVVWLSRAYHAALNAQIQELRPLELSPNAFNALLALRNAPDHMLEPCQLSACLDVSRPAVTGLIDTLQHKELVVRRAHGADRRRLLIELTPAGHSLLERLFPKHCARLNALVEALSEEEMATLVTLLQRIRGAVPDHLADGG